MRNTKSATSDSSLAAKVSQRARLDTVASQLASLHLRSTSQKAKRNTIQSDTRVQSAVRLCSTVSMVTKPSDYRDDRDPNSNPPHSASAGAHAAAKRAKTTPKHSVSQPQFSNCLTQHGDDVMEPFTFPSATLLPSTKSLPNSMSSDAKETAVLHALNILQEEACQSARLRTALQTDPSPLTGKSHASDNMDAKGLGVGRGGSEHCTGQCASEQPPQRQACYLPARWAWRLWFWAATHTRKNAHRVHCLKATRLTGKRLLQQPFECVHGKSRPHPSRKNAPAN